MKSIPYFLNKNFRLCLSLTSTDEDVGLRILLSPCFKKIVQKKS